MIHRRDLVFMIFFRQMRVPVEEHSSFCESIYMVYQVKIRGTICMCSSKNNEEQSDEVIQGSSPCFHPKGGFFFWSPYRAKDPAGERLSFLHVDIYDKET